MLHALIQDAKMKKIILSAIYDTYTKAKGEDSIFKIDSSVIRRNIVSRLNPFFFLNNLSTENHEMEEVATVNALTGVASAIEEAVTPAESIGNKFNKDNIIIYQGKDYEIIGLTKGKKNNNKVYYVIQSVEEGDEEGTIILIPEDDNIKLKEPPPIASPTTEEKLVKLPSLVTEKTDSVDENKIKKADFTFLPESTNNLSGQSGEKLETPEVKTEKPSNNDDDKIIPSSINEEIKKNEETKNETKDQTKNETKDQPKKGGSLTRRKQNKKKTLKRRKSYSSPTISPIRKGKNAKTSKTISNETRRPKKFSIVYRSLPTPK
jgi:hypothetical protein